MSTRAGALCTLLSTFFHGHLERVRGASRHTVRAYRDTLRLFLVFVAARRRRDVDTITLDDLDVDAVLAFLDHLEAQRGNRPATRNARLAALHGFFRHLLRQDPTRAAQYHRVLAVPPKKARPSLPTYLEPAEMRAVLAAIDQRTALGVRDYALLLFLYNTGARVGEALAVSGTDIELGRTPGVRLHGKGHKDRRCPLWRDTVQAIARLQRHAGLDPTALLFASRRGTPLTRDGVAYRIRRYVARAALTRPELRRRHVTPHVLRHSCAVALLQAGVDVTVIRDYLGHASIETTSRYVTTNLAMKRQALTAFWQRAGLGASHPAAWRPTPDVLRVLAAL